MAPRIRDYRIPDPGLADCRTTDYDKYFFIHPNTASCHARLLFAPSTQ